MSVFDEFDEAISISMAREHRNFENWLITQHGLTTKWNDQRNCYEPFMAHLAWKAWNASAKQWSPQ